MRRAAATAAAFLWGCAGATEVPEGKVELTAWQGTAPALDGVISPGEYDDATEFRGVRHWTSTFTPTRDDRDLSLRGWVKHDGKDLFFAFRVVDDVLYGIDTERWLPDENPKAHELTREGFPWFGDEMEILMNCRPTGTEPDGRNAEGSGASWQMVCNLTKSRLGGVGKGGLLEGEPRSDPKAWETYRRWIREGAMEAVAKVAADPKGYVIEWRIRPDPCLEVRPGVFWSPALGPVRVAVNVAVGDLDEKSKGKGNFGNFHHEDWWSGHPKNRTWLNNFAPLLLQPGPRP
jgi:SSS family solute:Na+ symporter